MVLYPTWISLQTDSFSFESSSSQELLQVLCHILHCLLDLQHSESFLDLQKIYPYTFIFFSFFSPSFPPKSNPNSCLIFLLPPRWEGRAHSSRTSTYLLVFFSLPLELQAQLIISKTKNIKHSGNILLDDIIKIVKVIKPNRNRNRNRNVANNKVRLLYLSQLEGNNIVEVIVVGKDSLVSSDAGAITVAPVATSKVGAQHLLLRLQKRRNLKKLSQMMIWLDLEIFCLFLCLLF